MTWWNEQLRAKYAGAWKDPVRMVTTAALPAYTRVGNVITADANGAAPTVGGVAPAVGDDVLIKDGAAGADNGIYTWTTIGSGSGRFVLTRRWDADSSDDVLSGMAVRCTDGTHAGQVFRLSTTGAIALNTTGLTFALDFDTLPTGSAAGQVLVWDGAAWGADAVDLALAAAVTGLLPTANLALTPSAPDAGKVLTATGAGAVAWSDGIEPELVYPLGTGADDWAPLAARLAANAYVRPVKLMSHTRAGVPADWRCATKQDLPNGSTILGSAGVTIDCALVYGGVDPFNAPFQAGPVASGVNTTLASAATVGALTVSSTANYSAGSLISIQTTSLRRQYYQVVSTAGAGPYTLTLDRPVRDPYPGGATVMGWTSIVRDIRIDGGGMLITGTADRYVEIAGAWDCHVRDLRCDTSGGALGVGSIALSYDIGCLRCSFVDIVVDSTGTPINGGVIIESGEQCIIERCRAANLGGASSTGMALYDSWNSAIVDCHASGSYYGAAFTGANGCYGCEIRGGSFWQNTQGIIVGNGTRNRIVSVDCSRNTDYGLYLVGELNPIVSDLVAVSNGVDLRISNCDGAQLHGVYLSGGTTRNLTADIGSGNVATITGLRLYVPSTNGTTFVRVESGTLQIHGLDVDDTAANRGVTTIQLTTGGALSVVSGVMSLGAAVHGIYNDGAGDVRVHDLAITGTTNGITTANGAGCTVRRTGRCNLTLNIGTGCHSVTVDELLVGEAFTAAWTHEARTTDAAPTVSTWTPQAPFATATGANRVPASAVVALAAPTNGGTTEAGFKVTRGGSFQAMVGPYDSPPTYDAMWLGPGITPSQTNMAVLSNGVDVTYVNVPSTAGAINLSFAGSSAYGATVTRDGWAWAKGETAPKFIHSPQTTDAATGTLTVRAQSAHTSASTNKDGGHLLLQGGAEKGSAAGKKGGVRLQLNATTETILEATEVAIGQRVVALCRGSDVTTTQLPANCGDRVVYLADCATAPTGTPVSGGLLYSSGGDLYWRDDAGISSQLN